MVYMVAICSLLFTGCVNTNYVEKVGGLDAAKEKLTTLINSRYEGYTIENREEVRKKIDEILDSETASVVKNDFEMVHTNTFIDLEEEFLLRMNPQDIEGDEDIHINSDAGTEGAEGETIGEVGIGATDRYDYSLNDWRIQKVNNRRGIWLKNVDIDPLTGEDAVLIHGEVYPLRLNPQYALPSVVKDPRYRFEITELFITDDGNFVANFKSKDFYETAKESYQSVIKELEEKASISLSEEERVRYEESLMNTGYLPEDAPKVNLNNKEMYKREPLPVDFQYEVGEDGIDTVHSDAVPDPSDNKEGEFFTKPALDYEIEELQPFYVTLTGQVTKEGKFKITEVEKITGVFVYEQ